MTRELAVFLPVPQAALPSVEDTLLGDPGRWLADARRAGPDIWRTSLEAGPLRREVACRVGPIREVPGAVWRDVAWNPVAQNGDRIAVHELLPHFCGELGLHRGQRVLILNGEYAVPGGRLGEITDAVALGGVARRTATRLLSAIIERSPALTPAAHL